MAAQWSICQKYHISNHRIRNYYIEYNGQFNSNFGNKTVTVIIEKLALWPKNRGSDQRINGRFREKNYRI